MLSLVLHIAVCVHAAAVRQRHVTTGCQTMGDIRGATVGVLPRAGSDAVGARGAWRRPTIAVPCLVGVPDDFLDVGAHCRDRKTKAQSNERQGFLHVDNFKFENLFQNLYATSKNNTSCDFVFPSAM
jgi:hypothetical protein